MKRTVAWFLRWLIYWASILEGLIGVVTLTALRPSLALKMAEKYSRYCFKAGLFDPQDYVDTREAERKQQRLCRNRYLVKMRRLNRKETR